MLQIPIFHVNGEDPEAVAQVVRLAMDFRREFQRDVVIDMYCYRRRGHNEGDEPSFTQPLLYRAIDKRKTRPRRLSRAPAAAGRRHARGGRRRSPRERREQLEAGAVAWRAATTTSPQPRALDRRLDRVTSAAARADVRGRRHRRRPRQRLATLLEAQTQLPDGFPSASEDRAHARSAPRDGRAASSRSTGRPAEALAFATLAVEGYRVRLTRPGQRARHLQPAPRRAARRRGRPHATCRLQHLSPDQAPVEIFNSPLSEAGVLGFEYGYSLDCPDGLVLWEAQFGDFVNAAQVIIDQFIASAEDKWRRLSGLVLLLPHGFEGQGPEHSSARLERFLALAAEDNIQVVQPDDAGAVFPSACAGRCCGRWRKPLVVMTPKSLLRHPQAVSTLDELRHGHVPARAARRQCRDRPNVERVLLCCGKVYYELVAAARASWAATTWRSCGSSSSIRLPTEPLRGGAGAVSRTARRSSGCRKSRRTWAPGGSCWLRLRRASCSTGCRSRASIAAASASPATGSASSHKLEQKELLMQAFGCI